MADRTAGYAPHDHRLDYVMIESATTAHDKGDLVNEGNVVGFAYSAVAITGRYRLDTEVPYYATKKVTAVAYAIGERVEFVAPTSGTTGTVQKLVQGIGFATVIEASTTSHTTVLVQPDRALYL